MTPLLPIQNVFAIPVPVDAKECTIKNGSYGKWIMVEGRKHCPLNDNRHFKTLFTTINATEQQAAGVVEVRQEYKNIWVWKDYVNGRALHTAKEALASLIRANGLSDKENYLLIQKK